MFNLNKERSNEDTRHNVHYTRSNDLRWFYCSK